MKPLSSNKKHVLEELLGLKKNTLSKPLFSNNLFENKNSLIYYTGNQEIVDSISFSDFGLNFADWIGERSLRLYPSILALFSEYFENKVKTDYSLFINGKNLPPNSYKWVSHGRPEARRLLVLGEYNVPWGIGLKKETMDKKIMIINEVNIGDFLKKEKKAKRRFK